MRYQPLPIVNGFYADDSRSWSEQDVCNWLPVAAEVNGTRTATMYATPPGLRPFSQPGSGEIEVDGVVRGTYNCEGKFFAVVGRELYQYSTAGTPTHIGTVPGTGRVSFSHNQITNGNQLLVVTGRAGYVYDTTTLAFTRITDPGYPGAIVADFANGYLIQIEPSRRFAFHSDLANAFAYNTLDRFTSETSPDLLVTLAVNNNQLVLFSETTFEVFNNTGAAQQPWRTTRTVMDKGCAGRFTVAKSDNTLFFLGNDGMFYRLQGYSPIRISTRPIEQAIRGLNWSQAFCFVWEDAGHSVIYWTFPDGHTWGYDVAQQQWHRRASYGLDKWRPASMTFWKNAWYAGDFQGPRIWKLDWDYLKEGDQAFVSECTTAAVNDNQNRMTMDRLEIIMDTGKAMTADHALRMQYRDQGDAEFGYWDEASIGEVGEYGKRIVFTRLGAFRNRVIRLQCSSPSKRDVLGAVVGVTQSDS